MSLSISKNKSRVVTLVGTATAGACTICTLPVIVAVWPDPAKVNVTPFSKFCILSNIILPAPLVTLLLIITGSANPGFIPKPLTVVILSITPFTDETGITALSCTAAVVVTVIVVNAIAKSVMLRL